MYSAERSNLRTELAAVMNSFHLRQKILVLMKKNTTTNNLRTYTFNGSRDSPVGIALGYGLDDRGSRV
jgi:hypothetical protein